MARAFSPVPSFSMLLRTCSGVSSFFLAIGVAEQDDDQRE
jgi:hypothetical protein